MQGNHSTTLCSLLVQYNKTFNRLSTIVQMLKPTLWKNQLAASQQRLWQPNPPTPPSSQFLPDPSSACLVPYCLSCPLLPAPLVSICPLLLFLSVHSRRPSFLKCHLRKAVTGTDTGASACFFFHHFRLKCRDPATTWARDLCDMSSSPLNPSFPLLQEQGSCGSA